MYFLTTMHISEHVGNPMVKRRQADGSHADASCPCLPDYQKHVSGVYRGDQLESYYNVGRKSKKWWRSILFYCLEANRGKHLSTCAYKHFKHFVSIA